MTEEQWTVQPLKRIPSGISGLDTILKGGFFQGGIYIVHGAPGTGKTILGNHFCFNHVAAGGRALYVTLLAESHARMLAHLRDMHFYDQEPIGDRLYYISGSQSLEQGGWRGLLELLRRAIRDHHANLLVIDGLTITEQQDESGSGLRRFLHELQVYLEATGCLACVLAHAGSVDEEHPILMMVDGLIELRDQLVELWAVRELVVCKFRGSAYLRGRHRFQISEQGIVVFPRTEALLDPLPVADERFRTAFGIPRLDEMLRGGLLSTSSTLLLGAPGTGKTLLGLHFLAAGARVGQPGLLLGFYEPPTRLLAKGDTIGLQLSQHLAAEQLEILWMAPFESHVDAVAEQLLSAVKRRQVRRLFIDGLDGLKHLLVYPERINGFLTALTRELQGLGVTTVCTLETPELFGPAIPMPVAGLSAIIENLILLRYVELEAQLYRLISIMKIRDSDYDTALREFRITAQGIDVARTFDTAAAILTGVPQITPAQRGPGRARRNRPPGGAGHSS